MNHIYVYFMHVLHRVRLVYTKKDELHDAGQATTEYALVLLGAAVIALLVIAWATDGGGAGRIGELFDTVLSEIFNRTDSVG